MIRDETLKPMADTNGSFELPADGETGAWRVEVHQGYPAMVDFSFSSPKAMLRIEPDLRRFVYSPELYWFNVPEEVSSFTVSVKQYYGSGPSALVFYDPGGSTVQTQRWQPPKTGERQWHEARVTVPPEARGKVWSMLVAVGGQFQMRMEGIPPFVARSRDALFIPPKWGDAPGR